MTTLEEYTKLKEKLVELKASWKGESLDANWICVSFPKKMWRLAKLAGAKKDYYYGWVLWSGSVNCNGSDLAVEVNNLVAGHDWLYVRERQL